MEWGGGITNPKVLSLKIIKKYRKLCVTSLTNNVNKQKFKNLKGRKLEEIACTKSKKLFFGHNFYKKNLIWPIFYTPPEKFCHATFLFDKVV